MTTPILGIEELTANQAQPHLTLNTGLRITEAAVQLVIVAVQNSPPGSPADGDRYIVGDTPTGAWVGHTNDVAAYLGTAWHFLTPLPGWLATNQTTGEVLIYGLGSPIAWDALETGGAPGGTTYYDHDADAPPVTPDPHDDEFDGASLDTAGSRFSGAVAWAWTNQGSATATLSNGQLRLYCPGQTTTNLRMIGQSFTGTKTFTCKLRSIAHPWINYYNVGMFMRAGAGNIFFWGRLAATGLLAQYYSSPTTFSSNRNSDTAYFPAGSGVGPVYLQMAYDGSAIKYRVSSDGEIFHEVGSESLGSVDQVGLLVGPQYSASIPIQATFDWFRRTA